MSRHIMLALNLTLTLVLLALCAWMYTRLPEPKPAPKNPPPPPRVPCSIEEAQEYLALLKQFAQQEEWKAVNVPSMAGQRASWLAAKAKYAIHRAREPKFLDDKNVLFVIEDTFLTVMKARHQNSQEFENMAEEGGSKLRTYVSPVDNTVQTYSVNVPSIYDPAIKWPLVVSMHGHGWYNPFQGHPAPGYGGVICLAPQGRGSTDYKDLGEDDVLAAIAEVKKHYNIDEDRVYLTGASMGGTGAFHLGVHYADQFAAICPIVGNADNLAWTERWGWNAPFEGRNDALRHFVQEGHTARAFACNLRNLPAYIIAGAADTIVPPAHSRNVVAELRRLSQEPFAPAVNVVQKNMFALEEEVSSLPTATSSTTSDDKRSQRVIEELRTPGYIFEYREYPGVGHGGFPGDATSSGLAWTCGWTRNRYPARITWKADLLKHGKAYWTRMEQFEKPMVSGWFDITATSRTELLVKTDNLLAFSIQKPKQLFDLDKSLELTIDDIRVTLPVIEALGEGEWITFRKHPSTRQWMLDKDIEIQPRVKKRGCEGPVHEAFMSPFVLVVGTVNPAMNAVWLHEAEQFARDWKLKNSGYPRIMQDVDVTENIEMEYNLILFGGAEDNAVAARLVAATPYKELQALVNFQNSSRPSMKNLLERPDVGSILVYPNPNVSDRLAVFIQANSPESAYQIWGRFGNWFNWGVFDSKKYFDFAIFDAVSSSPETMLLVGWFGTDWTVEQSVYYFGNEYVRATSAPQQFPKYATVRDVPQIDSTLKLFSLKPSRIDQMRGAIGLGRTFFGEPLPFSIGMRAPATLEYVIDRAFSKFTTDVRLLNPRESTLCKQRLDGEAIRFAVYGDGKLLGEAKVTWKTPTGKIEVDVMNVKTLKLEASPAGGPAWLHMGSAWVEPTLKR